MLTIYLVRHGETYLNKYKRMQGWADTPLTPKGEDVATETGIVLENIKFDAVYTSDLGRTIQTAKLIMDKNKRSATLPLLSKKAFRESFFGYFEGASLKESFAAFSNQEGMPVDKLFKEMTMTEYMANTKAADPYHEAENGEEFWERLSKGLDEVIRENQQLKDGKILIVTHGNVIRKIVSKIDATIDVTVEIQNASITKLLYEKDEFQVMNFNLTSPFLMSSCKKRC